MHEVYEFQHGFLLGRVSYFSLIFMVLMPYFVAVLLL